MVLVDSRLCIDKSTGLPLSPYYPPDRRLAAQIHETWEKQRLEVGSEAAREVPLPPLAEWQTRREVNPMAVSRPNVVPSGYVSGVLAERACANAGKRRRARVGALGGRARAALPRDAPGGRGAAAGAAPALRRADGPAPARAHRSAVSARPLRARRAVAPRHERVARPRARGHAAHARQAGGHGRPRRRSGRRAPRADGLGQASAGLVSLARTLVRSPLLRPAVRADLLSVALGCTAGGPEVDADVAALDDETRRLPDAARNLNVVLSIADLAMRSDRWETLGKLTDKPDFVGRWLSVHPNAAAAALLDHAVATLRGQAVGVARTKGTYELV